MLEFRTWLETNEKIPDEAIKVPLPKVRQQVNWSCGAVALRAICLYFNVGPEDEKDYIEMLGSNSKDGTWLESIIKHARELGLQVEYGKMSIAMLKNYLNRHIPVICSMQAWGQKKYYKTAESGHYTVACGYDDENIYFEDPSMDGGKRGYLKYKEFEERWHDRDGHGHDLKRIGIAIWKYSKPEKHKKITKAKKIE